MAEGLSHLLFPRLCMGCKKPLLAEEEILCLNCNIYNLPRTAYHHLPENETMLRFSGRFHFVKATSLAYFTNDGLLQHLLHELKYNNKKDVGVYLGRQLGNDLKQVNWLPDIDLIVPVPLHPRKQETRGYNQAALIATGISEVLAIPILREDVLVRTRDTESQTQKSREERLDNMQNAFSIAHADTIKDKHLLLVDDVLTTGATLESCALALLAVSGVRVSIATIGIAV